jgi:hypothetical protein
MTPPVAVANLSSQHTLEYVLRARPRCALPRHGVDLPRKRAIAALRTWGREKSEGHDSNGAGMHFRPANRLVLKAPYFHGLSMRVTLTDLGLRGSPAPLRSVAHDGACRVSLTVVEGAEGVVSLSDSATTAWGGRISSPSTRKATIVLAIASTSEELVPRPGSNQTKAQFRAP